MLKALTFRHESLGNKNLVKGGVTSLDFDAYFFFLFFLYVCASLLEFVIGKLFVFCTENSSLSDATAYLKTQPGLLSCSFVFF